MRALLTFIKANRYINTLQNQSLGLKGLILKLFSFSSFSLSSTFSQEHDAATRTLLRHQHLGPGGSCVGFLCGSCVWGLEAQISQDADCIRLGLLRLSDFRVFNLPICNLAFYYISVNVVYYL